TFFVFCIYYKKTSAFAIARYPEALQYGFAGGSQFINAACQYRVVGMMPEVEIGMKQCMFKGMSAVYIGKIGSVTSVHQSDLSAYGIVCRLDECGGGKHLFLLLSHFREERFRIGEATHSRAYGNGVGLVYSGLLQRHSGSADTHAHGFAHTPELHRGNVGSIVGFFT